MRRVTNVALAFDGGCNWFDEQVVAALAGVRVRQVLLDVTLRGDVDDEDEGELKLVLDEDDVEAWRALAHEQQVELIDAAVEATVGWGTMGERGEWLDNVIGEGETVVDGTYDVRLEGLTLAGHELRLGYSGTLTGMVKRAAQRWLANDEAWAARDEEVEAADDWEDEDK